MALITCHECRGPVSTEAAACPRCGAPVASARGSLDQASLAEVHRHLDAGSLIQAIAAYRRATGARLVDAKAAVERMQRDRGTAVPAATGPSPSTASVKPVSAVAGTASGGTSWLAWGCGGLLVLFVIAALAGGSGSSGSGDGAGSGSSAAPAPRSKTPEERKADYVGQLDRELASLRQGFDGSKYRGSKDAINMGVILFGAWGKLISEAPTHDLSKGEMAKVAELRRRVSQIQVREFPRLRASWAQEVGKAMWEHDMTVTAGGEGSRTLRLTAAMFAANANIQQIQQTLHDQLNLLRFKRVEYRWYRGADDYQYYRLETPRDGDVREITANGWASAP
jgi:hypothetical protein